MSFQNTKAGETSGTSLMGYLRATREELTKVFGEPTYTYEEGDKVTVEWVLVFSNGEVATIYDWKRYDLGTPELNEVYNWHIGGNTQFAVDLVHSAMEV